MKRKPYVNLWTEKVWKFHKKNEEKMTNHWNRSNEMKWNEMYVVAIKHRKIETTTRRFGDVKWSVCVCLPVCTFRLSNHCYWRWWFRTRTAQRLLNIYLFACACVVKRFLCVCLCVSVFILKSPNQLTDWEREKNRERREKCMRFNLFFCSQPVWIERKAKVTPILHGILSC